MRICHPSRIASAAVVPLSIALLAGCTTSGVGTKSSMDSFGNAESPLLGVSYYLPMRHAKVTFTRVKADDKADQAFADATTKLKAAEAALAGAKAATAAQASLLEAMKRDGIKETDAPYITVLAELVKLRQAEVAAAKDEAAAKAKANQAEIAALQLADSKAMCGWVDSVQVQLLEFVPDTSARYLLQPESSAFRSDTFKMTTTTSGLLQTTNIEQKDETGSVLINLARSITAWSSPSPLANQPYFENLNTPIKNLAVGSNRCAQLAWEPRKLEFIIDPIDESQWGNVGTQISNAARVRGLSGSTDERFTYTLSIARRSPEADSSARPLAGRPSGAGIFYRRERPLVVNIALSDEDGNPQSIGNVVLSVPNGAPIDAIGMDATAFVTNRSNLGFSNGMLVSVDNSRPSPAAAIASVPWQISEATLRQISALLTLRVEITQKETSAATEERALLEQMKAIIEAQEALDRAREAAERE
ncbi:hypothetical protein [Silanimonas sp.]|uniref:hypothetical protein n=1 Tax=Silanimonas sp. TaxID=1929290 RepID=UPI0022CC5CE1|nr:hypothetical protein [Silanimonas sp.]MCZ8063076.1 hypothetical protein [Silanimonas sp.]